VVSRGLPDGESLVLAADGTEAIVLNPMGAVVWDLCQGRREIDRIAQLICEVLPDAELTRVRDEVHALVRQLVDRGVLEDADAAETDRCGPEPSRS